MNGNPTLKHIRVDQVGSLVPDSHWRDAVDRYKRGDSNADELCKAQDRAIRAVIGKQEQIGLPVVSDGELRRFNFQESFGASVSGFDVPNEVRTDYRPSRKCGRSNEQSRTSKQSGQRFTRVAQ
jgi:5-methyltetrahydropteroyltriglutamate--homocysteine methyltransferase